MTSEFTKRLSRQTCGFDFVGAHFACESDRYSQKNPGGYVNFGSAQNFLHGDQLPRELASVEPQAEDSRYQPFSGTAECKQAIADYLVDLGGIKANADHLVVGNGIISLLEALAVAILDAGDTVLVPTPVFPGLVTAMSFRTGAKVAHLPLGPENDFRLEASAVESAILDQRAGGDRVKAILICSPGNPVGQVFDEEEIGEFVRIAEKYDCALIVDEVYAASCLEGVKFHSALAHDSVRFFVLGGLSKDFGLAGYATGWLHVQHNDIRRAVEKQAHFYRLPAPIQRTIARVLEPSVRAPLIETNRQGLAENHELVQRFLEREGVPVTPAEAGLCLWLDLSNHLDKRDRDGEIKLYRQLLEEFRVHLSPGAGLHCSLPGYFRICVSQEDDVLLEGLNRIKLALASRRPARWLAIH